MRYILSADFKEKLRFLANDKVTLSLVSQAISKLSQGDPDNPASISSVSRLENNIFVLRKKNIRIFFGFGVNEQREKYLLLLDLVDEKDGRKKPEYFAINNPKNNNMLNPLKNASINPISNSLLNPKFNSEINPSLNKSLNPKINDWINPNYNSSINPRANALINPESNAFINPKYNRSLNPQSNISFGGPFIYDLNLKQESFITNTENEQVILIFNLNADFIGEGVKTENDGFVLFDQNYDWIGYLVPNGKGGFLRFNLENEWTGFVI